MQKNNPPSIRSKNILNGVTSLGTELLTRQKPCPLYNDLKGMSWRNVMRHLCYPPKYPLFPSSDPLGPLSSCTSGQLTPVKKPVDWWNYVSADGEKIRKKNKNIKGKKKFSHDAPEIEGLDIPCSGEKAGKKKRKINIKKSSLRSVTHWVGRMAGRRWQYTMSKKFKCLLPHWGKTCCPLCWRFSYLPKSWKVL